VSPQRHSAGFAATAKPKCKDFSGCVGVIPQGKVTEGGSSNMSAFNLASLQEHIAPSLWIKLQQSQLFSKVATATAEIAAMYRLSGVPFFREYTDHSFQHSIDVFKTACEILAAESMEVLSADDLNFLLLACAIHDSGLHVTEDIFLGLTEQSNSLAANPAFDEKPWAELWTGFLAEAKRFSAKKLIAVFGDTQQVREPPRSAIDLSQRDRLLIGEFLRRHHPRYAHEFSLGIVPNVKGGRLAPLSHFDDAARDVVGLIARSHGMNLRSTFDYLLARYDIRDFNRVHIVFIMVVLRISDYLQIQPGRAPDLFNKIHNIRSPYSSSEWRVHQSIENITTSSYDPEAIHIAADPQSAQEFLKFERWSSGLQEELDISWAILGEVYGRFGQEHLDKLRLKIRRIRSNIEDKVAVQRRVKYVPEHIRFSVAEPELLKLLMGPLYSDNPLYGLRELTQNAIDSVREFDQLLYNGIIVDTDRMNRNADVEISISEAAPWTFCISDRGTGMTLDIIKNYFCEQVPHFARAIFGKRNLSTRPESPQ
jgi:molecular chaperone HtpG